MHHRHHRHSTRAVAASIKLPPWQRRGVYASTVLLTASGLLWLGVHFAPAMFQDELAQATAKLWTMRIHAAAALSTLVLVGSLLPMHIPLAWRVARNRTSGSLMVGIMLTLTLTGYALWYAPEGWARQGSAWLHWGLGAGVPLVLVLHVRSGRASLPKAKI